MTTRTEAKEAFRASMKEKKERFRAEMAELEEAHRKELAAMPKEPKHGHKGERGAASGDKDPAASQTQKPAATSKTAFCSVCQRELPKQCFSSAQYKRSTSSKTGEEKTVRCKQCVAASFNHEASFGGTQKGRAKQHNMSIFDTLASGEGQLHNTVTTMVNGETPGSKRLTRAQPNDSSFGNTTNDFGGLSITQTVTRSSVKKMTGTKLRPRNWGFTTYLDRLFGMRCFLDIMQLGVFPDAKDISESMGALQAATVHFFKQDEFETDKDGIDKKKIKPGQGCWKNKDVRWAIDLQLPIDLQTPNRRCMLWHSSLLPNRTCI
jgi:hypothetical protein